MISFTSSHNLFLLRKRLDLILVSEHPCLFAMSLILSIYQYRLTKISLSPAFKSLKNFLKYSKFPFLYILFHIILYCIFQFFHFTTNIHHMCICSFEAFFFLKLSNAKFLVIFPRNADNFVGVLAESYSTLSAMYHLRILLSLLCYIKYSMQS